MPQSLFKESMLGAEEPKVQRPTYVPPTANVAAPETQSIRRKYTPLKPALSKEDIEKKQNLEGELMERQAEAQAREAETSSDLGRLQDTGLTQRLYDVLNKDYEPDSDLLERLRTAHDELRSAKPTDKYSELLKESLINRPSHLDLSPLIALVDQQAGGNLMRGYSRPTDMLSRLSALSELEGRISEGKRKNIKEQMEALMSQVESGRKAYGEKLRGYGTLKDMTQNEIQMLRLQMDLNKNMSNEQRQLIEQRIKLLQGDEKPGYVMTETKTGGGKSQRLKPISANDSKTAETRYRGILNRLAGKGYTKNQIFNWLNYERTENNRDITIDDAITHFRGKAGI